MTRDQAEKINCQKLIFCFFSVDSIFPKLGQIKEKKTISEKAEIADADSLNFYDRVFFSQLHRSRTGLSSGL